VHDALGQWLQAYAHQVFDMPGQPAVETGAFLKGWHRHVMVGAPRPGGDDAPAAPIAERDWAGAVQAFRAHRRHEHEYVLSTIGELRDALWATVETVHRTATLEHTADEETATQLARAREAITRVGAEPQLTHEVLDAVARIAAIARARQEATREQYGALARTLDVVGQQLEEARRESTTDALTGLGNRKLFDLVLGRARQLATLGRTTVALVLIDADGLKGINDGFGHQAGDAALVGLARALVRTFMRQGDALCRIGGDEFAVILPNTDMETAVRLTRRFGATLGEWSHPDARITGALEASCGVAVLLEAETVETWVARADAALYAAKRDPLQRVVAAA
jgi:diguanylate cyclase (GGDEF)-like protein